MRIKALQLPRRSVTAPQRGAVWQPGVCLERCSAAAGGRSLAAIR